VITMLLCSRWAGRTTTLSLPTGRRFATPRITTRSKLLPPITICDRFGEWRCGRICPSQEHHRDNPASDSTPLYSPDGKYIAYRAQQRPGYESDRFRLMLFDRKTGRRRVWQRTLMAGWARSPGIRVRKSFILDPKKPANRRSTRSGGRRKDRQNRFRVRR